MEKSNRGKQMSAKAQSPTGGLRGMGEVICKGCEKNEVRDRQIKLATQTSA